MPDPTDTSSELPYPVEDILAAIEQVIRATTKAYGYRHLADIGQHLRREYPDFRPADYGCKTLLRFVESYPELFKVKWSAPARKGASHVWVRLATEPKRKEGYAPKKGTTSGTGNE
jgi:hypothetical protein